MLCRAQAVSKSKEAFLCQVCRLCNSENELASLRVQVTSLDATLDALTKQVTGPGGHIAYASTAKQDNVYPQDTSQDTSDSSNPLGSAGLMAAFGYG